MIAAILKHQKQNSLNNRDLRGKVNLIKCKDVNSIACKYEINLSNKLLYV